MVIYSVIIIAVAAFTVVWTNTGCSPESSSSSEVLPEEPDGTSVTTDSQGALDTEVTVDAPEAVDTVEAEVTGDSVVDTVSD